MADPKWRAILVCRDYDADHVETEEHRKPGRAPFRSEGAKYERELDVLTDQSRRVRFHELIGCAPHEVEDSAEWADVKADCESRFGFTPDPAKAQITWKQEI